MYFDEVEIDISNSKKWYRKQKIELEFEFVLSIENNIPKFHFQFLLYLQKQE